MHIIGKYKGFVCVVESMDSLYQDSHGIWRDKNKNKYDLVGTWIPKKSFNMPIQLSLFD